MEAGAGAAAAAGGWDARRLTRLARGLARHPVLLADPEASYELSARGRRAAQAVCRFLGAPALSPRQLRAAIRRFVDMYHAKCAELQGGASSAGAPPWVRAVRGLIREADAPDAIRAPPDAAEQVLRAMVERARALRTVDAHALCRRVPGAERVRPGHLRSVWARMVAAVTNKLHALVAGGDSEAGLQEGARLSRTDWRLVDALLLHERGALQVVREEHARRAEPLRALVAVFHLVQLYRLEEPDGVGRWRAAAAAYRRRSRRASAVLLQRRWHELKLQTRRAMFAVAWRGARGGVAPLHLAVARRYPHVVLTPLLSWQDLVAAGAVLEECQLTQAADEPGDEEEVAEGREWERAEWEGPLQPGDGEGSDEDDLILVEREIETVDLLDNDDAPLVESHACRVAQAVVPAPAPADGGDARDALRARRRRVAQALERELDRQLRDLERAAPDHRLAPLIIFESDEEAPGDAEVKREPSSPRSADGTGGAGTNGGGARGAGDAAARAVSDSGHDARAASYSEDDARAASLSGDDAHAASHSEVDAGAASHSENDAGAASHFEADAGAASHSEDDALAASHSEDDARTTSHCDDEHSESAISVDPKLLMATSVPLTPVDHPAWRALPPAPPPASAAVKTEPAGGSDFKCKSETEEENESETEGENARRGRIRLPDIAEVRRTNRGMKTAQVAPLTAPARSTASRSSSTDGELYIDEATGECGALTESELQRVLRVGAASAPCIKSRWRTLYCCPARYHRALNDARRRCAARSARPQPPDAPVHAARCPVQAECRCCCVHLLDAEGAARALAADRQRLLDDVRAMLDGATQRGGDGGSPLASEEEAAPRAKKPNKKKQPRRAQTESPSPAAADPMQEWIRQKNLNSRFFDLHLKKPPPKPAPTVPQTPGVLATQTTPSTLSVQSTPQLKPGYAPLLTISNGSIVENKSVSKVKVTVKTGAGSSSRCLMLKPMLAAGGNEGAVATKRPSDPNSMNQAGKKARVELNNPGGPGGPESAPPSTVPYTMIQTSAGLKLVQVSGPTPVSMPSSVIDLCEDDSPPPSPPPPKPPVLSLLKNLPPDISVKRREKTPPPPARTPSAETQQILSSLPPGIRVQRSRAEPAAAPAAASPAAPAAASAAAPLDRSNSNIKVFKISESGCLTPSTSEHARPSARPGPLPGAVQASRNKAVPARKPAPETPSKPKILNTMLAAQSPLCAPSLKLSEIWTKDGKRRVIKMRLPDKQAPAPASTHAVLSSLTTTVPVLPTVLTASPAAPGPLYSAPVVTLSAPLFAPLMNSPVLVGGVVASLPATDTGRAPSESAEAPAPAAAADAETGLETACSFEVAGGEGAAEAVMLRGGACLRAAESVAHDFSALAISVAEWSARGGSALLQAVERGEPLYCAAGCYVRSARPLPLRRAALWTPGPVSGCARVVVQRAPAVRRAGAGGGYAVRLGADVAVRVEWVCRSARDVARAARAGAALVAVHVRSGVARALTVARAPRPGQLALRCEFLSAAQQITHDVNNLAIMNYVRIAPRPPAVTPRPPDEACSPPANASRPPDEACSPPAIVTRPSDKIRSPPAVATQPPDEARSPPAIATRLPDEARSPPAIATRPPEEARSPPAIALRSPDKARSPPGIGQRLPDEARSPPATAPRALLQLALTSNLEPDSDFKAIKPGQSLLKPPASLKRTILLVMTPKAAADTSADSAEHTVSHIAPEKSSKDIENPRVPKFIRIAPKTTSITHKTTHEGTNTPPVAPHNALPTSKILSITPKTTHVPPKATTAALNNPPLASKSSAPTPKIVQKAPGKSPAAPEESAAAEEAAPGRRSSRRAAHDARARLNDMLALASGAGDAARAGGGADEGLDYSAAAGLEPADSDDDYDASDDLRRERSGARRSRGRRAAARARPEEDWCVPAARAAGPGAAGSEDDMELDDELPGGIVPGGVVPGR